MDFTRSERVETIVEMVGAFMKEEVYPLEPAFRNKSFRDMLPDLEKVRD